ncbi:DUF4328 domain-containing protein [Kitasatospora sp. NPDC091335]|uniref:DUF4328 domain-containing protein n=1 Tax=Kitasatospora sp. NPDC091335 TaxID=3364085 RepID=UPI0037FACFDF
MPSPAVYRSPRSSAIAATVMLAVSGAVSLVSLGTSVNLYGEVGTFAADVDLRLVDGSAVLDAYALHKNVGTLQVVTLVASVVAFIVWFHRVRVNAEILDPHGHRLRRGFAIGAWFLPIANLWIPRQIAGDIWQAGARPDGSGVRPRLPQTLLTLWWGASLGAGALARIGTVYTDSAEYPDTYQQGVAWLIASDLAMVAAAVLAVLVVRRLTATQEQRFAEGATAAYGVHGGTVWG